MKVLFKIAHDIASVVGFFEDDLFELWVWFSFDSQFSVVNYEFSIGVAYVSSARGYRVRMFAVGCQGRILVERQMKSSSSRQLRMPFGFTNTYIG